MPRRQRNDKLAMNNCRIVGWQQQAPVLVRKCFDGLRDVSAVVNACDERLHGEGMAPSSRTI